MQLLDGAQGMLGWIVMNSNPSVVSKALEDNVTIRRVL